MKKKTNKKADHLFEPNISLPDYILSNVQNKEVNESMQKFKCSSSAEDQIGVIRSLSNYIKCPENKEIVIDMFSYLFINLSPKNPVKKSILRILMSNSELQDIISVHISSHLKLLISNINLDSRDFQNINVGLNAISGCFEHFPAGVTAVSANVKMVLKFLVSCLTIFSIELSSSSSIVELQTKHLYVHNATRCLVSVLQKCPNDDSLKFINDIFQSSVIIINDNSVPYDTKSNCGIMLVILANLSDSYLKLLEMCFTPNLNKWSINSNNLNSEISIICICSGILNVVDPNNLHEHLIFDKIVTVFMCNKLMEMSTSFADNSSIVLSVNRTLLLISRILSSISSEHLNEILQNLLQHIWIHLDHPVDTIRHLSKSTLSNLTKLAISHRDKGNEIPLLTIMDNVLNMSPLRSMRYTSLTILGNEFGCVLLLKYNEDLIENLLSLLSDSSISNYVTSCYDNLMRHHLKEVNEDIWIRTWILPLTNRLQTNDSIENESLIQTLLASSIKLKPNILNSLLSEWAMDNDIQLSTLLKCALVARHIGAKIDTGSSKWRHILDESILQKAMFSQIVEIRISSLALIAESSKSTEIFNSFELNFVIEYFKYNVNPQLPSTRQQIMVLLKKIIVRVQESYYTIVRDLNKYAENNITNDAVNLLMEQKLNYEDFLSRFRECVFDSLFVGANFSRRTICLEILIILMPFINKINEEGVSMPDWTSDECECIVNCLDDNYESNKQLAVQLLAYFSAEHQKLHNLESVIHHLKTAMNLASSVRPSNTATAAYMFETVRYSPVLKQALYTILDILPKDEYTMEYLMIVYFQTELNSQLCIAKENLLKAASSSPMHGVLFCLRHMIEKYLETCTFTEEHWNVLISKIINMCFELNDIVGSVVNSSSPEGHLPMDQETASEDETVTAQMLLVCAWRTVKEVSLLLGELTLKAPITTSTQNGILTEEQIFKIGEHFTVLLTETKHRGAFEQAYVGFSKLCSRLWRCTSERLHKLPVIWLEDILSTISGQKAQNSKLCATRRSAGVPFMIQAIVASELQTGYQTNFQNCITTLLDLAKITDETPIHSETRTHAMNILRVLYRNTQLGEVVMPFIADGIIVSILGFTKKSWGERNSATVLFSSLITRIFGVQRTCDTEEFSIRNLMTTRIFFLRFPNLYPFLLKEFRQSLNDQRKESALYPILLLLARLYSSSIEECDGSYQAEEFIPLIRLCARNRIINVRQSSARALESLAPTTKKLTFLKELCAELENIRSNLNYQHGILLQIFYLIKSFKNVDPETVLEFVNNHGNILMSGTNNFLNAALYMDILVLILSKCEIQQHQLDNLLVTLTKLTTTIEDLHKFFGIGTSQYIQALVHLYLHVLIHLIKYAQTDYEIFNSFFIKCLTIKNIIVNEFMLNFLIYLFDNNGNSILIDCWDIPDSQKALVHSLNRNINYKSELMNYIRYNSDMIAVIRENIAIDNQLTSKFYVLFSHFIKDIYSNEIFSIIDLIDKCTEYDDDMNCAAFCCLRMIISEIFKQDLKEIDYENLFNILYKFSLPYKQIGCRYILACILVENSDLLIDLKNGTSLFLLWQSVMNLLDDSNVIVRNKICSLSTKLDMSSPKIAEKTRENLFKICTDVFKNISNELYIELLLYWTLNDRDITENDDALEGLVFEKGEVSTFVETFTLNKLAAKALTDLYKNETLLNIFTNFRLILNGMAFIWTSDKSIYIKINDNLLKHMAEENCSTISHVKSYLCSMDVDKNVLYNLIYIMKFL